MSARVLITGASGGIGSAAMAELRSRGASVVGLDLEADEAAGVLACDLREPNAVQRAVADAVARLAGLDVLINNAGLGVPQSAGKAPDEAAMLPRPPLAAAAARRAGQPRRAADGETRRLLGARDRRRAVRALVGSLRRA